MTPPSDHFDGKQAIAHVAEAQAKGILSAAEIHGTEIPGHISAGADAARDTCLLFLLLLPLIFHGHWLVQSPYYLLPLVGGWLVWRGGRAAWLGWARLERLHRVLEQEKWEIDHNRAQEKDELRELYRAKGFEGKLLEDVLDVLMADGDRLLRVMVEEELGLSLEKLEHPLKQGIGAAIGVFGAGAALIVAIAIGSETFAAFTGFVCVGLSGALLAYYAQNRMIPAITWNIALAALAFAISFFTFQLLP